MKYCRKNHRRSEWVCHS